MSHSLLECVLGAYIFYLPLLTLEVQIVTNINFLPMISVHCQEIRLWELIKWSPKRKCFDLLSNSLNSFFKEIYRGQFGEFVYGYWGFKGLSGKESGVEMHFAIVSGIITGDALFSYWPIFFSLSRVTAVSPCFSRLRMFCQEEPLWLSDRNLVLMM